MQKKNNTKEGQPRRSRMPQLVYQTAQYVWMRLSNFDGAGHTPHPPDEILCAGLVQPLRELSSLACHEELTPDTNSHPHNEPWKCRCLIVEAMRLAYGLQDLLDAGKKISKFDRERCARLFEEFENIKKAADVSIERWRTAFHKEEVREVKREEYKEYTTAFGWPFFDLHPFDTVTVKEDGQAEPGQLILVKPDDGGYEDSFFTRCCFVKGETIRVCGGSGEPYDKPLSTLIGAVVDIKHKNCTHAKIVALSKRIEELRNEHDAICNTSRIAELEKQIYNLERSVEEEEEDSDSDEWPDEIDG